MNKNLAIFIIITLIVGAGVLWYSNQTTKEIENNTQLPDQTEIEAPDNGENEEEEEEKMTVEVYFNNSELNTDQDCSKVFAVERTIEKTQAPARKALELLIAGPTAEEKTQG